MTDSSLASVAMSKRLGDSIALQIMIGGRVLHEERLPIKGGVFESDVRIETLVDETTELVTFRFIEADTRDALFQEWQKVSAGEIAIFEAKRGTPVLRELSA